MIYLPLDDDIGCDGSEAQSSENGEASQLRLCGGQPSTQINPTHRYTFHGLVIFERNASSLRLRKFRVIGDLRRPGKQSEPLVEEKRVRRSPKGEGASVPTSRTSPTAFQKDQRMTYHAARDVRHPYSSLSWSTSGDS